MKGDPFPAYCTEQGTPLVLYYSMYFRPIKGMFPGGIFPGKHPAKPA